MTTLKTMLVGATTVIAAVVLTAGPVAASAKAPAETLKEFWGTGSTAAAAHSNAEANAADLGCQPIASSGSASQQPDGSWKAWVNAWCGIL
jgi:hypothetical protein